MKRIMNTTKSYSYTIEANIKKRKKKSDGDRHQHRNYVNHKFSLWMLEHEKSGEKKRSSLLLWFQSKCDLGHFTSNAMTVVFKTFKQAKRGERLFNVNFTILIQPCCSSIQFHIKLARLVITPKNGSFLITFTLISHLKKKS